jgi:hypothetical protein
MRVSVALGSIHGRKAHLVREDELSREQLLLLRDGLMEALSDGLTQKQLGFIFRLHPEHVGRILRNPAEGQAERVHAILQGRLQGAGWSRAG